MLHPGFLDILLVWGTHCLYRFAHSRSFPAFQASLGLGSDGEHLDPLGLVLLGEEGEVAVEEGTGSELLLA